ATPPAAPMSSLQSSTRVWVIRMQTGPFQERDEGWIVMHWVPDFVVEQRCERPEPGSGQLAGVRTGDGLEALDALELPLEWPGVRKPIAVDKFPRAQVTQDIPREPHVAVAAAADAAQHFVIGDGRRLTGRRSRTCR